jgi:hypothetical protein
MTDITPPLRAFIVSPDDYLKIDGSNANTNIDIGDHKLTAEQLASDIATGTSPLLISSTTTVSNLNADLLDGLHASEITGGGGGIAESLAIAYSVVL